MSTIKDVARACGVSPATVSYVMNDGPRYVHPQTRERVLRAARELSYYPSAVARGLQRRRMDTFGVVLPHALASPLSNPYFAPILEGIMDTAIQNKQNVMVFAGHMWSDALHSLPIYCDGRCDGLLLLSPPTESDIPCALRQHNIPFVVVGDTGGEPQVASVDIDNVGAAQALVCYLLQQGHRRIALLCGDANFRSMIERLRGYREALEAAGVSCEESLIFPGHYHEESGYENARLLLDRHATQRPTALFCGNDLIALGALRALKEAGVRVPDDISVVGFDDIPAAVSQLPLTTVRQPLRLMGERAAELLLAQIANGALPEQKQLLDAELIVRDSVAPYSPAMTKRP